ncbi:MAG: hypothetical protein PHI91_03335 [Candidatus Pacebacteria bacterium]|nr:hypothetical protein [Candidatus Paceibacterota bacterium]MDD2757622.1 hypothetical protein [Candidatus Paceibacterota bacterium]MDD3970193.1 hypothetical protein [Candidatus Paceibacterota bacterium]
MKKIYIITIIVALAILSYLLYSNLQKGIDESGTINLENISLPATNLIFSELADKNLPKIDLESGLGFKNPEINLSGIGDLDITPNPKISVPSFNFSMPIGNISLPQQQPKMPSGSGWSPNTSNCAMFSMVPSCSFVPQEHQDKCEQCKQAGY